MSISHIVLDLETLDTESTAAVFQIGCAVFNKDKPYTADTAADLSLFFNRGTSILLGNGSWSTATIDFWNKQPEKSKDWYKAGFTNTSDRWHPASVLKSFVEFVDDVKRTHNPSKILLWGNGSTFDNVILRNWWDRQCKQFDLKIDFPIGTMEDRCFRTLKETFKCVVPRPKPKFDDCHNALYDALNEADWLQQILNYRESLGWPEIN